MVVDQRRSHRASHINDLSSLFFTPKLFWLTILLILQRAREKGIVVPSTFLPTGENTHPENADCPCLPPEDVVLVYTK